VVSFRLILITIIVRRKPDSSSRVSKDAEKKRVTHDSWKDGRAAFVADPDGIWIELLGPSRTNSVGH
jgi:hypothetical protein